MNGQNSAARQAEMSDPAFFVQQEAKGISDGTLTPENGQAAMTQVKNLMDQAQAAADLRVKESEDKTAALNRSPHPDEMSSEAVQIEAGDPGLSINPPSADQQPGAADGPSA